MTEAYDFFVAEAGPSIMPSETGRAKRRYARELAVAEGTAKQRGWVLSVEPDDEPYDGEDGYDGPVWVVTLEDGDGNHLASLGSVACPEDDPYLRVVGATLALEAIEGERARIEEERAREEEEHRRHGTPRTLDTMILDVVAGNGVPFRVVAYAPGATGPYPSARDDDHALVEFYDRRYAFTEHGQFTGGRYGLTALLARRARHPLTLTSDIPDWQLDAATMELVRVWLRGAGEALPGA